MAQTITLQRGSTTVTGNGTSFATLFTNGSTGIATRVIVNQLQISGANAGNAGECNARLFNNGSGSARTLVGQAYSYSSLGSSAILTFFPSQVNQQSSNANSSVVGIPSYGAPIFANNVAKTSVLVSGTVQPNYTLLPTTFWIGPSDVVQMSSYMYNVSGKSNTPSTVTIAYSFTLITES